MIQGGRESPALSVGSRPPRSFLAGCVGCITSAIRLMHTHLIVIFSDHFFSPRLDVCFLLRVGRTCICPARELTLPLRCRSLELDSIPGALTNFPPVTGSTESPSPFQGRESVIHGALLDSDWAVRDMSVLWLTRGKSVPLYCRYFFSCSFPLFWLGCPFLGGLNTSARAAAAATAVASSDP